MREHRILVASCDGNFIEGLRKALATTNYGLLHAKDGQEAIDYLNVLRADIHLAIITLELPVRSGLDLIWTLVRQKQPKPLKIIAVSHPTVYHGPLLEKVAKKFGVDAVVRQPMAPQEWRKTVEAVLHGQLPGHLKKTIQGLPAA